ncbi:hypothetical protein FOZ60_010892 [Perkinsus olseni]|nr:hypothetical protein FOZ60_010892 [Perkinsus olseni]
MGVVVDGSGKNDNITFTSSPNRYDDNHDDDAIHTERINMLYDRVYNRINSTTTTTTAAATSTVLWRQDAYGDDDDDTSNTLWWYKGNITCAHHDHDDDYDDDDYGGRSIVVNLYRFHNYYNRRSNYPVSEGQQQREQSDICNVALIDDNISYDDDDMMLLFNITLYTKSYFSINTNSNKSMAELRTYPPFRGAAAAAIDDHRVTHHHHHHYPHLEEYDDDIRRMRYHFDDNVYNEIPLTSLITNKKRLLSAVFITNNRFNITADTSSREYMYNNNNRDVVEAVAALGTRNVYFIISSSSSSSSSVIVDYDNNKILQEALREYIFTIIYRDNNDGDSADPLLFGGYSYPPMILLKAAEYHTILIVQSRDSKFWIPLGIRAEDALWRITSSTASTSTFNYTEAIPFLLNMIHLSSSSSSSPPENADDGGGGNDDYSHQHYHIDNHNRLDDIIMYRYLNLRYLQDSFIYHYGIPPESRLTTTACTLCKLQQQQQQKNKKKKNKRTINSTVIIFMGILSKRDNYKQRQAIRDTWIKNINTLHLNNNRDDDDDTTTTVYKFFVGGQDDRERHHESEKEEDGISRERLAYDDIVELHVTEGYRHLTKKSILMYEWIVNENKMMMSNSIRYFIRVDDDVYLRPMPLIHQLLYHTIPVR